MNTQRLSYQRHRFLSEIISHAVLLYYRLIRNPAFQVWQDFVCVGIKVLPPDERRPILFAT
jgi:hypothetical protein